MKIFTRTPYVFIVFVALCSLLLFLLTRGTPKNSPPKLPQHLVIPAINVNATIEQVGKNSQGEMEVPHSMINVGWYKFGSLPGEKGNAVITGHFDGENNEVGVFRNLHKLNTGDKLYIEDTNGKSTTFIVREKRTYNPGYADEVFSPSNTSHLNLVTCDGVWDGEEKSYSKRLVVFADIVH